MKSHMNKAWLVSFPAFFVALAGTFFRTHPTVPDEVGYIAVAKFLSAHDAPTMASASYYYFGYSLFILPAALFDGSSSSFFFAAMMVNSLAIALCIPVLLGIAKQAGYEISPKIICVSIVVAFWPSQFWQAYVAWSELLFRFFFLLLVLQAMRLAQNVNINNSIFFVLVVGALYAIHPRALPLLPVASVYFALCALNNDNKKADYPSLFVGLIGIVAVFLIMKWAHWYVYSRVWESQVGDTGRLREMIQIALTPFGFKRMILVSLGQIWYQLASTLGLAAVGTLYLLWNFISGRSTSHARCAGFIIVCILAVFAASVGQMINPSRLDHVVYGRYVDGCTSILVFFGLLSLIDAKYFKINSISWIFSIIIMMFISFLLNYYMPILPGISSIIVTSNVSGVYLFSEIFSDYLNSPVESLVLGGTMCASAIALLCYAVRRYRDMVASLLIFVLYVFCCNLFINGIFHEMEENNNNRTEIDLKKLQGVGNNKIFWHQSAWGDGFIYFDQLVSNRSFDAVWDINSPVGSYYIVSKEIAKADNLKCIAYLGATSALAQISEIPARNCD